jgi:Ion channel
VDLRRRHRDRYYSRSVWQPLRDIRVREQYGKGLLLLLIAYLLSAVQWQWIDDLAGAIFILILLVIVANQHVPRVLRLTAFTAGAVSAAMSVIRVADPTQWTIAADAFSTMIVGTVSILAIISRLLTHVDVTRATVMGAFLAYALFGFSAAFLYIGIDAVSGDPFFNQGQAPAGDYIYFSLVTLTTVGFGDLTAATDIGKRLVVIEAIIGQVFIVVLVGRLVSLWKPPDHRPQLERD